MAKTYDDLIPKKQAFVDAYLKTGDRDVSYVTAGYKPSPRSLKANARKLYIELQPIIQIEMEKRIGSGAVLALSVIFNLMQSAESESVKLAAAKDYLQRAGYDKPIEQKVIFEDLRSLAESEVDTEIAELMAKATIAKPRSI